MSVLPKIAWERHGAGVPLILIHGLGYARWGWEPVLPGLAERFEVIVFDNRGIGASDAPAGPYTVPQLATDTERLFFDDPSCAFHAIAERDLALRHVWFRDSSLVEESWLDWREVGFVPAPGAPMDGGLAAVPAYLEGAMSFSEASSRILLGER